MPDYGDINYWNLRYSQASGETFDWLEDYTSLQPYLRSLLHTMLEPRILNLGCGNSLLPERLYDDGYPLIHNVDLSEVVIA